MKTIKGNLLDFPEDINCIFHQANTENVMGAGIARQIRERYPEAYEVDVNFHIPQGSERLGEYTFAQVGQKNGSSKLIYNLYGQQLNKDSIWGVPTDYFMLKRSLEHALTDRINFFGHYDEAICGFPKLMGCGLGGGDWQIVQHLVEKTLSEFEMKGYWVEYND